MRSRNWVMTFTANQWQSQNLNRSVWFPNPWKSLLCHTTYIKFLIPIISCCFVCLFVCFLVGAVFSSGMISSVKLSLIRLWKQLIIPFTANSALNLWYKVLIVTAYSVDLLEVENAPVSSRIPFHMTVISHYKIGWHYFASFYKSISVSRWVWNCF